MSKTRLTAVFTAISLILALAVSGGAELSGKEIVKRTVNSGTVKDLTATMEMRIINKLGQERIRQIVLVSKKAADGGEMMLLRFEQPAEVRGTGFLSLTHPQAEDETWLYLPALGKPRRIAAEEKSGSFMGSDFSYSDIGLFQVDDFANTLIRAEKLGDEDVYVVESTPASDKIKRECGFARKIWWIRKANFTVVKAVFLDDKERQFKLLQAYETVLLAEDVWFNTRMEMKNLQTNSHTVVVFKNIKINTGVSDDYFTQRQLTKTGG